MSFFRGLSAALGVDAAASWVILGAAVILAGATGIRGIARARRSDDDTVRAWRSAGTWWILFGTLLLILASGRLGAVAAMALLSLLLLREAGILTGTRRLFPYLGGVALLLHLWVWLDWRVPLLRVLPPVLVLILGLEMLARLRPLPRVVAARTMGRAALLAFAGPVYTAGVASLPLPPEVPENRMGWLLLFLLLTELNDMAQSWWGRAIGARRLAPVLSPGKTWEGLWGGLASTVAASLLLCPILTAYARAQPPAVGVLLPGWSWALGIGILIGVTGVAGDLLASSVKRRAGVKDSGVLLPGHGGVLDRFDSLALAAPAFFFVTYFVWFGS